MPAPVSLGIIIVCAAIYLGKNLSPALALWPFDSGFFVPWQLVTYGFLHGGFNHLFFNMFAVWMFGTPLETAWGSQRFAIYYATCVIGAAIIQLLVQQMEGGVYPTIGASGGVFGLLLAYYGGLELMFGVTRAMPGIAHFAHLGGMIFGAGLLYKWGWRPGMTWKS
jgi:membrane associated rhomboid family serine protease